MQLSVLDQQVYAQLYLMIVYDIKKSKLIISFLLRSLDTC